MRRSAVAAATLAAALVAAAGASATSAPPPQLLANPFHLVILKVDKPHRASCSAQARKLRGDVGRVDRKVTPVACEQPPRANTHDAGFVVILSP